MLRQSEDKPANVAMNLHRKWNKRKTAKDPAYNILGRSTRSGHNVERSKESSQL